MEQTRTRDTTFPLFDALRGIAALMVFVVHAMYQYAVTRPDEDPGWYRFAIHLDVAVPIFFAISGFLLYRPFVAARVRGRPLSVRAYAWRRFLRIAPAYWVALAAIVIWFDLEEVKSLGGALWYGGFLQLYSTETALSGLVQAWTLSVEVAFYAFLPLWVFAMARWVTRPGTSSLGREALGTLGLIALGWAWQAGTLLLFDINNLESASVSLSRILPVQFDHLGAGMLLAVLSVSVAAHRAQGTDPPLRRLVGLVERRPWIPWAGAAALWLAATLGGRSGGRSSYSYSDREFFAEHVLYTPAVLLLLAPAVFGDDRRTPVRKLLAWRPLAYVGMVSYSFYLWHIAIVGQQARWWGHVPDTALEWVAWMVPALAATLVVASLSFFVIERPFMNLKYRTGRRGRPPTEAEAAQVHAAP